MLLSLKITRSENHSQKYFGESLIFMIDWDWRCFFCPLAVWRESTQTEFGKLPDTLASYWSMSGPAGPLIGWPHSVQYTGASHRNRLGNSETVSCPPPSVSAPRGNYRAISSQFHTKYSPGITRDITGFKTIQAQPRSAGPGRSAGWCETTFDISFNYPPPSSQCLVWSQTSDVTSHTTVITTTFNNFPLIVPTFIILPSPRLDSQNRI